MIEFNPSSPQHISCLLFGGTLTAEGKELIGMFKTGAKKGLEKYKNIKYEVRIAGIGLKPLNDWETKKRGVYSTGEDVLKIIALKKDTDGGKIADTILSIRGLNKELSTYFVSTKDLIYPDGKVHGQYQSCKTSTGRKAHNNPNLGNQPKPPSNVTKHFVSRFTNGIMIAADYKSIDVRCEAELCGDRQYIQDTIDEVDMHTKNLSLALKVNYEAALKVVASEHGKALRSKIKGFTFSQQYLASVKTSAKASGLTEQEVTDILEARKQEYPQLYKWHTNNNQEVEKYGFYYNMLGMKWYFKQYPTPLWKQSQGVMEQYSPNEISNFKTQGTAGCIVDIMIGKFWREKALYNRDKYSMVNQVHDNLILDCKEEYKEDAKKDLKVLEDWVNVCYNIFKYQWKVPIKIEISEGKSWYECF